MKKFFLWIFVAFLSSPSLFSYSINGLQFSPVSISVSADVIRYNWKKKSVELIGNVLITYDDMKLLGKKLFLDEKKFEFYSPGTVKLQTEDFVISGRDVVVKLMKKYIYMKDVEVLIPQNRVRIKGKEIKIDGQKIEIKNAYFTSCNCQESYPFWEIKAKKIKMEIGGYSWIINGKILLKGLTFFWMPALVVPAKYKKETGFLFPSFTFSNARGVEIHVPFYIDTSPWSEGIIQADYYSRKGIGLSGQFNYRLAPQNEGSWNLKSVFGRNGNFVEFFGHHHKIGTSSIFGISSDVTFNPFARASYWDDPEKEGEEYLTSSLDWKNFFHLGALYGNLAFYQYLNSKTSFYSPSFGYFSYPILTPIGAGNIWSRLDAPKGLDGEKRFLAGDNWNYSLPLFNSIVASLHGSLFFEITGNNFHWSLPIIPNVSLALKGNGMGFEHKSFFNLGYRKTLIQNLPEVNFDGWDSLGKYEGFYLMQNDFIRFNKKLKITYRKIFYYNNGLNMDNFLSVSYPTMSLSAYFSLIRGRVVDLSLFTTLSYDTSSFSLGMLNSPKSEEEVFNRWLQFAPYTSTEENRQVFVTYVRALGNVRFAIEGRWMLDMDRFFEQGFSVSYSDPCRCFSMSFSYRIWPYKQERKWSLWISFGNIGAFSF